MTFLFQAKSLGLLDPPAKGRGRGVVRGRGRGTPLRSRPFPRMARVWTRESASLDHRPKQITVDEIMLEQKEDTAEHFRVSNKCNYHNKFLGDHYITFRMCSGWIHYLDWLGWLWFFLSHIERNEILVDLIIFQVFNWHLDWIGWLCMFVPLYSFLYPFTSSLHPGMGFTPTKSVHHSGPWKKNSCYYPAYLSL